MQKICSQCAQLLQLSEFAKRTLSSDKHNAACKKCRNEQSRTKYWIEPAVRQAASVRATAVKAARFARDPAYKRAFTLWNTTKKRHTKIPPWVKITDFLSVCAKVIAAGPDYELDHEIPLKGKLVCGLHVPGNLRVVLKSINHAKHNHYAII